MDAIKEPLGVIFLVFLVRLGNCSAVPLHFPKSKETVSVCDDQQQGDILINSSNAEGGRPPITYNVSGGNGFFRVDPTSGQVSAVKLLQPKFQSQYILNKTATDKVGDVAILKVAVIVLERRQRLRCPNLDFNVREVAPIGEAIGKIQCTKDNIQCVNDQNEMLGFEIFARKGYQPFAVTTEGHIVVSSPVVFRNSMLDIIIVNVRVFTKHTDIFSGTTDIGTETNITLNITVVKSDCPSNWTYVMEENMYLAVPSVTTLKSTSVEECKSTCSRSLSPCNGFVYSLVQRRCDLISETRNTQPEDIRSRPGSRLYCKQCLTEPLPSPEIRAIYRQLSGNGSVSTEEAVKICKELQDFLAFSDEVTYTDICKAAELLTEIIERASFGIDTNHSCMLIEAAGHTIDNLLSDKFEEQWEQNAQNGHGSTEILRAFDTLSNRAVEIGTDIEFVSNTTKMRSMIVDLKNPAKDFHFSLKLSETSSVLLPSSKGGTEVFPVRLFIGILEGISKYHRPTFHDIRRSDERQPTLVGHVLSVAMSSYEEYLYGAPFQLDIFTPRVNGYIASRRCVFLRRHNNRHPTENVMEWFSDGCWVVFSNETHTRCHCNHLTNFGVLMQVTDFPLTEKERVSLDVITIIGCCLSIAALSTTLIILLWLRLQSDRYILLMNLSAAIILGQVLFLSAVDLVEVKIICRLVAILLHYLFLAVFTLMLAQGIQLYHKLHRAFSQEVSFTMYFVLGWGTPFVLVSISLATNLDGYGTDSHCWLSTKEGAVWAFVGPALTIVSINMVLLIVIMRIFLGVKVNAKKNDTDKFLSSMKATFVLLPLLGITWLFGVLAINNDTVVFQYLFALLNSLQESWLGGNKH